MLFSVYGLLKSSSVAFRLFMVCLLAEAVIHKPVISKAFYLVLFKSPDTTDIDNLYIFFIKWMCVVYISLRDAHT